MHWLGHYAPGVLLTAALVFGIDLLASGRPLAALALWPRLRPAIIVAGVVVLATLGLLSYARGGDARPFIYGRF